MDARMMEVLVFVDGVDAMTSKVMQARRSYEPSEMMLNEQVRGRGGGAQGYLVVEGQRGASSTALVWQHACCGSGSGITAAASG
jgi:hypothetical protein